MSSMKYAGKAFRKGDKVLVNLGWNRQGTQRFMTLMPDQLQGHVDPKTYNEFMVDLKAKLEGKGVHCPIFCLVCPLLSLPILPCLCYQCLNAIDDFENIIKQTIDEHQHKFGNRGAVQMKLVEVAEGNDQEAAMGYNILFDLSRLPQLSASATSAEQGVVYAAVVEPQLMEDRGDPVEKLKQLKDLLDAGAITQAEYKKKKAPLLERL